MRRARLKVPADGPLGYYHCLSRVVDRQFIVHEAEKDQFVSLLREHEAFCEVEVLTYCVMDNHFHVLVEVPKRPEVLSMNRLVAQASSLLYRRLPVGRFSCLRARLGLRAYRRLETCETADWKSALLHPGSWPHGAPIRLASRLPMNRGLRGWARIRVLASLVVHGCKACSPDRGTLHGRGGDRQAQANDPGGFRGDGGAATGCTLVGAGYDCDVPRPVVGALFES